jgi:hypothetical protein
MYPHGNDVHGGRLSKVPACLQRAISERVTSLFCNVNRQFNFSMGLFRGDLQGEEKNLAKINFFKKPIDIV